MFGKRRRYAFPVSVQIRFMGFKLLQYKCLFFNNFNNVSAYNRITAGNQRIYFRIILIHTDECCVCYEMSLYMHQHVGTRT